MEKFVPGDTCLTDKRDECPFWYILQVKRYDCAVAGFGMVEDDMAAGCMIFDKSQILQSLMSCLEVKEGSLGICNMRIGYRKVDGRKECRFVRWDRFVVLREACDVSADGVRDHRFGFGECFAIGDAARERGDDRRKSTLWLGFKNDVVGPFLVHSIGIVLGGLMGVNRNGGTLGGIGRG